MYPSLTRLSTVVVASLLASASALAAPAPTPSQAQYCPTKPPPTGTYPSKCDISHTFAYLAAGNFTAFFAHVSPNVTWTLMGTHPLAGTYHNRTVFATDALGRLGNTFLPGTSTLELVSIVGGGTGEEWSAQELHGTGVCKNGLKYDNTFSWVTRWSTEGIIVEVRAWLDSALVARAITENESPEFTYTDQRLALEPGPVGINCAAYS